MSETPAGRGPRKAARTAARKSTAARAAAAPRARARAGAEEVPKLLLELLAARGPSGYEHAPAQSWLRAASAFAEVSSDVMGTPLGLVSARVDGGDHARRLLVMGHIDEIGLIVTYIDDDGYLWFRPVGGWDAQILVGQRLVIDTREGPVTGVVGKKPIHLLREDDRKKVPEIRELHVDIGASDAEDAPSRARSPRSRGAPAAPRQCCRRAAADHHHVAGFRAHRALSAIRSGLHTSKVALVATGRSPRAACAA